MPIREDIVASAVSFLQDPNVVSSPTENKLSFLRSKHLTPEEIDIAFARSGSPSTALSLSPVHSPPASAPQHQQQHQQHQHQQQQQPPFYGQYQAQPYGWQPPPLEPPKRDWRDWFIMATVMGGVGYGLYFITKRYIYPLVSPPTPDRLEQDKSLVDEQFDKAFSTLEQLAKDTDELKQSEKERTEKLDKVLEELESFMRDSKSASRRHEDETERLREEMKGLKGVIPKSMSANKEFTDNRLKEITNEVKSLRALIGQRMNNTTATPPSSIAVPPPPAISSNGFLMPLGSTMGMPTASAVSTPGIDMMAKEIGDAKQAVRDESSPPQSSSSKQDYLSALGSRSSPFGSGMPAQKASIPAWQLVASGREGGATASQQQDGANGNSS